MARQKQKIRPTVNNARQGKNGVFQAQHLDSEHGKAAQMNGLLYTWHRYQANGGWMEKMTFEQVEDYYYHRELEDGLYAQNMKYKKKGNYKRIRDMDDYRTSVKTCPESTLYYLGNMRNNAGADVLQRAVAEFLAWREQEYPQVVTLDWAVHIEDGAPHVHERHVWIAHDADGNKIVNQERALEEMGVLRADEAQYQADIAKAMKITDKKKQANKISQINRYNNRKMTYTETCRDKMIEIAKSYGIEIEDEPREPGQKGLSQARFKADDEKRRFEHYKGKAEHYAYHGKRLQKGLQGDLRAAEAQEAIQGAAAFLAAVGAAVRPQVLPTPETPWEVDTAIKQPEESGAGEQVRTKLMQQAMAMANRGKARSGPPFVEGPTR